LIGTIQAAIDSELHCLMNCRAIPDHRGQALGNDRSCCACTIQTKGCGNLKATAAHDVLICYFLL
jgi:hypothetical protein